ncbi:hypothetical protein F4778DRAFT_752424 [Xylariomycetidae sp. FL2044]|nr:hypothetical protein F4778DRAFT_752424 [Xylariomycetidae sp. FL2044]
MGEGRKPLVIATSLGFVMDGVAEAAPLVTWEWVSPNGDPLTNQDIWDAVMGRFEKG